MTSSGDEKDEAAGTLSRRDFLDGVALAIGGIAAASLSSTVSAQAVPATPAAAATPAADGDPPMVCEPAQQAAYLRVPSETEWLVLRDEWAQTGRRQPFRRGQCAAVRFDEPGKP